MFRTQKYDAEARLSINPAGTAQQQSGGTEGKRVVRRVRAADVLALLRTQVEPMAEGDLLEVIEKMERETGIEPATFSLGNRQQIENKEHSVYGVNERR